MLSVFGAFGPFGDSRLLPSGIPSPASSFGPSGPDAGAGSSLIAADAVAQNIAVVSNAAMMMRPSIFFIYYILRYAVSFDG